jgi:DNA-binding IclR family transcriptional regulator
VLGKQRHQIVGALAGFRSDDAESGNGEGFEETRGVAVPILGPDRRPIVALLRLGTFVSASESRDLVRYLKSVARELADRLKAIGDMPVS